MANLIATEAYAKNIGGVNTSYTPNLGCTKSRAIALGCTVAGTYANNLLVCLKDLSKTNTIQYSLRNASADYLSNIRVLAGSCIFTGNLAAGGVLYTTVVPSGNSWSINYSNYMVYPNPNSNIRSYTINRKNYSYDLVFTLTSPLPGNNYVRVFMLSNMDSSLVGTKNYIRYLGLSGTCFIYYQNVTSSPSNIGTFTGNQCYNLGGALTMINGNRYSVLYTVIDSSNSNADWPGYITETWRRLCEFTFYSNTYQYTLNVRV